MSGETVFNSINGKLILEEDELRIKQSLVHRFNNLTQFSVKPSKIPLEDIEDVYTENKAGVVGKPKVFVKHGEDETEFRFYNKNNKQKIEGETESLNGEESAERLSELLENKIDRDQAVEVDVSETEETQADKEDENSEEDDSEGLLSKMSKTKEYKRVCNECGETWHVLAKRERKVKRQKAGNSMQNFGANISCCFPMSALSQSNVQSSEEQLEKMRSCPECGSHNYDEETIRYEK